MMAQLSRSAATCPPGCFTPVHLFNEWECFDASPVKKLGYKPGAHVFPDELRDSAGQHEAGDGAAHDVEQGVHDPCAGGGFDRGAEGTAERAGGRSTATAYLRRRGWRQISIHTEQHHLSLRETYVNRSSP